MGQSVLIEWQGEVSHDRVLGGGLWQFLSEDYLVDLRVTCHGLCIKGHKLVLALFFPILREQLLKTSPCSDVSVSSCDMEELNLDSYTEHPEDVRYLMEFAYTGRVAVPVEHRDCLFRLADAAGSQNLRDSLSSSHSNTILNRIDKHEVILESRPMRTRLLQAKAMKVPKEKVLTTKAVTKNSDRVNSLRRENRCSGRRRQTQEYNQNKTFFGSAHLQANNQSKCHGDSSIDPPDSVIPSFTGNFDSDGFTDDDIVDCQANSDGLSSDDQVDNFYAENHQTKSDEQDTPEMKEITSTKCQDKTTADGWGRVPSEDDQVADNPELKCPHCDYVGSKPYFLKRHLVCHTGKRAKRHVCKLCKKVFGTSNMLRLHRESKCGKELPQKCKYCGHKTLRRVVLLQHMAVKHNVDGDGNPLEKNVQCPQCDFVCVAKHQLQRHFQAKHACPNKYKCEECNYTAPFRSDMLKHVRIRHQLRRDFMCESCGFRSQSSYGLTHHVQHVHQNLKPYKCDVCGAEYSDRTSFKLHREKHDGVNVRRFVCHICAQAFLRRTHLKTHCRSKHNVDLGPAKPSYDFVKSKEDSASVIVSHSAPLDVPHQHHFCEETDPHREFLLDVC